MTGEGRRVLSVEEVADEVLAVLGQGRQVAPFTTRDPGFDLAEAYAIAGLVRERREARGEQAVGRKIGFTNRAVWDAAGITAPIWGYMYAHTVHDLAGTGGTFSVAGFPEPRIEPEIAVHFARAPDPGMVEEEIMACIDWVAHGFEIVHSIFPGWRLKAADAVAACGVHTALLLGPRHDVSKDHVAGLHMIGDFDIALASDTGIARQGSARNVLGGPLSAIRHCLGVIAHVPGSEPIGAGEIVTTGTLTEAMPVAPGETWTTRLARTALEGLALTIR
ncbi:MAG: hydratase [Hyphomicrobiaceae bacterium]|nr:hydratase [Hyphomicrobiaceae bacterium]